MTSQSRGWFPSSLSWLNAALLYGLLQLFGLVMAAVVPLLLELLERSPRLAMVGFLALAVSPAVAVTLIHHFGHGALDRVDRAAKKRDLFPSVTSWWAGVLGWFILIATSTVTMFLLLVLFPPEPDQAAFVAAATKYAGGGAIASLHSVLWVVIASLFYDLERRARADD